MFSLVKGNTLELPSPTLLETSEKNTLKGGFHVVKTRKKKGNMEI